MDDVGFAREVRQKIETMKKRLIVCIFALLIISVNAVAKGNYEAVVAGDNYFVVLKTDGSLWAWGDNRAGQLGDGTKSYRQNPVKVMDDVPRCRWAGSTPWLFAMTAPFGHGAITATGSLATALRLNAALR